MIVWMTRPSALQFLLECVECGCKTGCKTGCKSMRCSCMKADLKCTDLCACLDCQNRVAANTEGMLSDAEDKLADESEFDCSDDL